MLGVASPTLFVVLADPGQDREPELHQWYEGVHGPEALATGSFEALNRYRAVGPGWHEAPFLALWEARYLSDAEAWAEVGPRARELRDSGRLGDMPRAVYALMLFHAGVMRFGSGDRTVRSLVTVQNDWRDPAVAEAGEWFEGGGLDQVPMGTGGVAAAAYLYTSGVGGPTPGRHLALFESPLPPGEVQEAWRAQCPAGAAGMSPTPVFRSVFSSSDEWHGPTPDDQPPGEPAWVMCWEPIARLG